MKKVVRQGFIGFRASLNEGYRGTFLVIPRMRVMIVWGLHGEPDLQGKAPWVCVCVCVCVHMLRWECLGLYRDNGNEYGSYYIIMEYILGSC